MRELKELTLYLNRIKLEENVFYIYSEKTEIFNAYIGL